MFFAQDDVILSYSEFININTKAPLKREAFIISPN